MKLLGAALAALFISGCSILASKEATVGCQVADAVSTVVALKTMSVHEANPIMAGVIQAVGLPGFVILKILFAMLLVNYSEEIDDTAEAGINVTTCGIAVVNSLGGF